MTATAVEQATVLTEDESVIEHWYCCNEDIANCGADISNDTNNGYAPIFQDGKQCVVCLYTEICPICGSLLETPDNTKEFEWDER